MAKAQNKMNFGHNAEFGIQVGIYSGKANHTFGVEAVSESSQNRKDFRETVLKAVQEYKEETSTEVTTESDFSSESTESAATPRSRYTSRYRGHAGETQPVPQKR